MIYLKGAEGKGSFVLLSSSCYRWFQSCCTCSTVGVMLALDYTHWNGLHQSAYRRYCVIHGAQELGGARHQEERNIYSTRNKSLIFFHLFSSQC